MRPRFDEPGRHSNLPVPESKLIGYYSVDGDRKFLHDASTLMYYNTTAVMKVYPDFGRVHMNLNEGREVAVRRDFSVVDEGISLLLQWIKLNHERIRAPPETGRWIEPQFVCKRGTLEALLSHSVTPNDSWTIYAAKWKGTIYLCTKRPEPKPEKAGVSNDDFRKWSFWGRKFEQYILSKSPDELPDTTQPVIEAAEFRCVYQHNIGSHSVMFCSIMKGLLSNEPLSEPLPLDELKFIEVMTTQIIENDRQKTNNFNKYKTLKCWMQLYLTNTKYVLCGFRDEDGIVRQLTTYNLQQIIEMAKPHWKPEDCVNSCESILTKIQKTVIRECNDTIYKFEKCSDGGIDTTELSASSEHAFLPSSFLDASG